MRDGAPLSWQRLDEIVEVSLHREPCNEIGTASLEALEALAADLRATPPRALVVSSDLEAGFCAGADLRELYDKGRVLPPSEREAGVRRFLERIHRVLDAIDEAPFVTVAAVHGVVFGGGFELALACDLIVADRTARFGFPELRLGLIPGFGGIPRLSRDCGNAMVRDLLLTGRSVNADTARAAGFVTQVAGAGQALRAARAAAAQARKLDPEATAAAKAFAKPRPEAELRREIEVFCRLFPRPEVQEALRRFVESDDVQPYLP